MNFDQSELPELRELNEMLELAGSITDSIDRLALLRNRLKIQVYTSALLALFTMLVVIILSVYISSAGKNLFISLNIEWLMSIVILFFALMATFSLMTIRNTQLVNVTRDLQAEIFVHQKVTSLIDEQTRRVRNSGPLSPLKVATLEVRLARLDRSNLAKILGVN